MKFRSLLLLAATLVAGMSATRETWAQVPTVILVSGQQTTVATIGGAGLERHSKDPIGIFQQAHAAPVSERLPPGTTIFAELSTSLSAKKSKLGDSVEAKCMLAVLSHGKVIIPSRTRIVGHITSVKLRTKDQPRSELGISFDEVVLADGTRTVVPLVIQAIGINDANAAARRTQERGEQGPAPATFPTQTAHRTVPYKPAQPVSMPAGGGGAGATQVTATLNSGSRGVVGLPGLSLTDSSSTLGSLVRSEKKNVKLYGGTEMVLRVVL